MPTYEYACRSCNHAFEEIQKISEPPIDDCPKCGQKTAQRLISQGNFILKGGGWYVTGGYGSSNKRSDDSSASSSSSSASSSSSSTSSPSAPAATSSSTPSTAPTSSGTSGSGSASNAA